MTSSDMLSINNVAAKLGLSVHQLRRWELMFGLEIKRGRGQQRQYREEDMSVLERIKELVEQGWPTSQIRPQLEAEGLLTPKLIGAPPAPGNPEVLQEAIIGLRNFSERRFIDLSKQIDELRQLLISVTLKQELSSDKSSPWQPMASEYVPAPKAMPAQEITIGPQISIDPPKANPITPPAPPTRVNQIPPPSLAPSTSGYSSGTYPATSASEGGQRPIIGAPVEAKSSMPNIEEAPKPITDALQRSMSTLDSLFKDPRSTPGLGSGAAMGTASTDSGSAVSPTSSTTSSSSVPTTGQPVRYSTIPPTPTATPSPSTSPVSPTSSSSSAASTSSASPTTSTTSASQTPSVSSPAGGGAPWSSSPSDPSVAPPATSFGISGTSAEPAKTEVTGSTSSTSSIGSTSSTSSSSSTPSTTSTSSASSAPNPPASGWDQAFTATSVDMEAAPSGLFESSPAETPERNPFTTITSTSTNAVDTKPVDSSAPALMGQPVPSTPGFAGNPLNQTGPLPAHTTVESFAPEQKDKLIASQSDSTSTDLPRSEPESAEPAAPPPPPPLPITAGPQVNFGPSVPPPTPQVTPQRIDDNFGLGEVTDQNYLTVLGRALDLIGWSDEQADSFSLKTFGVPHWDELGRSQAEKLVSHLVGLLKEQLSQ